MDLVMQGDARGHKKLTINQLTEDKKEHWNISLEAAVFPIAFENSNSSNRQVSLMVVDGDHWNAQEHTDTMLIPLVLTAITNIDGAVKCYYQSRFDYQADDSLQAKISAMITLQEGQSEPITNPHLQVSFSVAKQEMGSRNEQSFGGAPKPAEPYVNTIHGENANGGLDIPLDQMSRPLDASDKLVMPV